MIQNMLNQKENVRFTQMGRFIGRDLATSFEGKCQLELVVNSVQVQLC